MVYNYMTGISYTIYPITLAACNYNNKYCYVHTKSVYLSMYQLAL